MYALPSLTSCPLNEDAFIHCFSISLPSTICQQLSSHCDTFNFIHSLKVRYMSQIQTQVVTRDVWRCMLRQSEKQPCGLHTMSWSHLVLVSLFLYSPRKAEGDTVPLLRDTMTLIPVSMKGTEKSMTSDLSSLMVREPTAMRAFFDTTCSATTERHTHGGNVKGQPAYMLLNILIIVEEITQPLYFLNKLLPAKCFGRVETGLL